MNKAELLDWLNDKHKEWIAITDQFTPSTWEIPGVAGYWSMKDVLAHLIGWNRRLVANMEAKLDGQPDPAPPWPADLETDDEINDWVYKTNKSRSVDELLDDEERVFNKLLEVVGRLSDDVEIETRVHEDREFHIVHLNDQLLHPGEFFDHYRDDHKDKVQSFLEKQTTNQ